MAFWIIISSNVILFDGQRKKEGKKKLHQNPKFENFPFPTTQQSNGLVQQYVTRKGKIEKDFDEIMKNPRFVDIEREKIWGMQGEVLKILRKEKRKNRKNRSFSKQNWKEKMLCPYAWPYTWWPVVGIPIMPLGLMYTLKANVRF